MAPGPDREKALDLALAQIDKQFGKGSVMRLGERPQIQMAVIPTGSIALDVALGVGGLPRGRVVEIYGPESSGKTTVALHAVASAQRAGGIAAFIDAEHALDPEYAKALGVDTDAMLVSQPDTGEQALEIADMLIRSGALDIIVIDSVAALVPRAEIEGEMGDSHVGLQARLMSQALRKITGVLSNTNTTAIFINQLREKIGVMFGSPETTTGGRALKFYASVRLDVRRIESLKDGTDVVGNRTRVKVVKNKVAAPFKQAEFDIMYGKGISREGSLIDVGVEQTIIRKSGAWYTYDGDQLGQGKEKAREFLKENPDVAAEIEKKILEKLGVGVSTSDAAGGPELPPVDFDRSPILPLHHGWTTWSPLGARLGCRTAPIGWWQWGVRGGAVPRTPIRPVASDRPVTPVRRAGQETIRAGPRTIGAGPRTIRAGPKAIRAGPRRTRAGRRAPRRRRATPTVSGPARSSRPGPAVDGAAVVGTPPLPGRHATRANWPGRSACANSPCARVPGPSWRPRSPDGASVKRSPTRCSTGMTRSASSTTPPSRGPGSPVATRGGVWPAGRWPTSCGNGVSTATSPPRRSANWTRRPRARPPAPWWIAN